MNIRPVCVECACEMRCKKNGYMVRHATSNPSLVRVYHGDCYECPRCEAAIVTGFGKPREVSIDISQITPGEPVTDLITDPHEEYHYKSENYD